MADPVGRKHRLTLEALGLLYFFCLPVCLVFFLLPPPLSSFLTSLVSFVFCLSLLEHVYYSSNDTVVVITFIFGADTMDKGKQL